MNSAKVYVDVEVCFRQDGVMVPRRITWEDGQLFSVDRVTDIRQAAAPRAGGHGERYTITVMGRQSYLYFERSANRSGPVIGRWFVERRRV